MSKVKYSNEKIDRAIELASCHSGELTQHDAEIVRGKGNNEYINKSYVAIFTFEEPIICTENEVSLRGGYFINDDNEAEVTQLIGRFKTDSERNNWVNKTFEFNKINKNT